MPRVSRRQQKAPSHSIPACVPDKRYQVAIYARLSVEDNGKDADSIDSQIAYLEQYIAGDPTMQRAAVFIDNGYTGTNLNRPEFQRMLAAARAGEINCIVVKDLSRLGRSYVETGEFLEKVCPFLGLRFIAVNDGYDSECTTHNTQLAASLSGIINDFYAKDISRKVCSALNTKIINGKYIGAWEKYGYLKDPNDKNKLVVNPETAPIVQQIFRWRSEGMSYMGINKRLNAQGVPSPGQYKANRGIVTNNNQKARIILWNKHIVTDILKDITYLGHIAQRKSTQCLYRGIGFCRVDEKDWVVVQNTHEPIIDKALFEQVQQINRAATKQAKASRGKYDHLVKQKNIYGARLVCADCGARIKLVRSFSTKKDKAYFTFKCPTYAEHGDKGCTKRRKTKAEMDEAVFHAIRVQIEVFMDTARILKDLLAQKKTDGIQQDGEQQRRQLGQRIQHLHSSIAMLYADLRDGLLTDEDYTAQKNKYQAEVAVLEQQLARHNQDNPDRLEARLGTKRWARLVEQYADATELTDEMVEACVQQIQLCADGSLSITFRYMDELAELLDTIERLKKGVA